MKQNSKQIKQQQTTAAQEKKIDEKDNCITVEMS